MFCRNCGQEFSSGEPVCPYCGSPGGKGSHYCPRCSHPTDLGSVFCSNCGATLSGSKTQQEHSSSFYQTSQPAPGPYAPQPKSKLAAVLLAFFLGSLGIHNFYLGYTSKALWQLLLGILCCGTVSWCWAIVDAIMILCGNIDTDGAGIPLGN